MNVRLVGAELFHADNRRTDMTKRSVAFCHVANALKKKYPKISP